MGLLAVDHNNNNNTFLATLFYFSPNAEVLQEFETYSRNRHTPHLNRTVNLHTNTHSIDFIANITHLTIFTHTHTPD